MRITLSVTFHVTSVLSVSFNCTPFTSNLISNGRKRPATARYTLLQKFIKHKSQKHVQGFVAQSWKEGLQRGEGDESSRKHRRPKRYMSSRWRWGRPCKPESPACWYCRGLCSRTAHLWAARCQSTQSPAMPLHPHRLPSLHLMFRCS